MEYELESVRKEARIRIRYKKATTAVERKVEGVSAAEADLQEK